jgi:hypothetical protein
MNHEWQTPSLPRATRLIRRVLHRSLQADTLIPLYNYGGQVGWYCNQRIVMYICISSWFNLKATTTVDYGQ